MLVVFSNKGYDSERTNQTACKWWASSINKGNGLEAFDYS